MPGARRTHCLACKTKKTHAGQHRYAEITPALPAQRFYGLLRALAGVPGLLASVARRHLHGLDPSVGGPRPRDLTVRAAPHVLRRHASIATRLTSGDEWPSRPSCRGGMAKHIRDVPIFGKTYILRTGAGHCQRFRKGLSILPVVSQQQHLRAHSAATVARFAAKPPARRAFFLLLLQLRYRLGAILVLDGE
jgi:hypothetical protein